MSDARLFAGGLAAIGIAALTAVFLMSDGAQGPAQAQADTAGPNLNIEVSGEASGTIVIDLRPDKAPRHVEQIVALAESGAYDDVVFHRVIDGFMAQTGDVQYGKSDANLGRAGTGGSDRPDLPAEFNDLSFERGAVGMARAANPNSANSQFFIMFAPAPHLNGQYTVVGTVISGMDVVDTIKKGSRSANGAIQGAPDRMVRVTVTP